jgi:WD40 repeat protein
MFDDPDGDWCLFQKLRPTLPAADLTITADTPHLRTGMAPTPAEAAAASLTVPPLVEAETVWSLAWSPCGRFLASGGDHGGLRLWARTGTNPDSELVEVSHTSAHRGPAYALAWAPGPAAGLLASAGGDGRVIVWQVAAVEGKDGVAAPTMEPIAAVSDAHGAADINSVAWNVREDGKGRGLLSTCADDGSVKIWRVAADE